jgi:type I restriction enzyme S subunit
VKKRWPEKPLGDVCCIERKQARHKGIPYVGLEHIESGTGKFVGTLSPASVKSNTFAFTAGSVLFGRLRPYLKKVLLPTFAGHCSTEIFPLRPSEVLASEYLVYWLLQDSVIDAINGTCTGARMPRANMDAVMDFAIPVPPLHEQRRIVAILDEAFEGVAAAKANTENNLRNAKEVFHSRLASLFDGQGEGWMPSALESLVTKDCTLSYGIVQPGDEVPEGLPVVRPVDLKEAVVGLSGVKRIDPSKAMAYRRTVLQGGEVLLCVRGTTGTVSLAASELAGANVTRGIVPIRFDKGILETRFGLFAMRSPCVQAQIQAKTTGTALKQINIGELRRVRLRHPPVQEQTSLAVSLSAVESHTLQAASLCAAKLTALDELKASLLHQAFTGQL